MSEIQATVPYRVLARKYRPNNFAELIGQDALVRTLTNAIATDRLAHAFLLTGVRGVGKTTTARIIARSLNCVEPDGTGGPTAQPCGQCEHCTMIAEDRHVDVIEMDAASRTGVDDVRELIEGVRYRPVTGRFKIYIIDEVHMLSRNAFNALLKTLEEPPEHVKFIFATTEARRVPVTVLSRCQRFDLRRIDADALIAHFAFVAESEGARISPEALRLIARAADGSVRDGLSLLDQAIAHGGAEIGEEAVRDMLGLADRDLVFDLFEHVIKGEIGPALTVLSEMVRAGAEPAMVMRDLLDLTHFLTRLKLVPEVGAGPTVPETERTRGKALAEALPMAALARAWQMLLKGLAEVNAAPQAYQAVEMVLARLAYVAELPLPADVIKRIDAESSGEALAPMPPGEASPAGVAQPDPAQPDPAQPDPAQPDPAQPDPAQPDPAQPDPAQPDPAQPDPAQPDPAQPDPAQPDPAQPDPAQPDPAQPSLDMAPAPAPVPYGSRETASLACEMDAAPDPDPIPNPESAPESVLDSTPNAKLEEAPEPASFPEIVALAEQKREAILATHLLSDVHLVRFEPGRIEIRPEPQAPSNLAGQLSDQLGAWTGRRWVVRVSDEAGAPTLAEQRAETQAAHRSEALDHPLVRATLAEFPGATIKAVHSRAPDPNEDDIGDGKGDAEPSEEEDTP